MVAQELLQLKMSLYLSLWGSRKNLRDKNSHKLTHTHTKKKVKINENTLCHYNCCNSWQWLPTTQLSSSLSFWRGWSHLRAKINQWQHLHLGGCRRLRWLANTYYTCSHVHNVPSELRLGPLYSGCPDMDVVYDPFEWGSFAVFKGQVTRVFVCEWTMCD